MKGTDLVTKLKKMDISRIAICRQPADQDADIVLVKSETGEPEADDAAKPEAEPEASLESKVDDESPEPIEKSPHLPMQEIPADANDDGGKLALQDSIKSLVKQCNESKIIPKRVKQSIGNIAKYHGVEGPNVDDDGTAGEFAEVTAQLRAVVDILKGLAISASKPARPVAEPEAKPAAQEKKPSPAKKSASDERLEKLEKQFEKTRFLLLQAMGKDPTPLGE